MACSVNYFESKMKPMRLIPMTKWLILLSLLFVNTTYANNTQNVLKKERNHTIKHSSFLDKHSRIHASYTKQGSKSKLHVAHFSGGQRHAEARNSHSHRVHTILARRHNPSMSRGSGLLARNLTDDQIGSILDHYRVSDNEQSIILTSINNASAKHHKQSTHCSNHCA